MSKTPGGQAASDKFLKKEAQSTSPPKHNASSVDPLTEHGDGAANAPGHSDGKRPGEAPVASDSGSTNVGIDNKATNVPGEEGIKGVTVSSEPQSGNNFQKT